MKVIYLRDAKERGYIRVGFLCDGKKEEYCVSSSDYRGAGELRCGDSLSKEQRELLFLADMRYRAKKKALNILSYGDNSEKMLYLKLCRSGIDKSVAKETARQMVGLGYINDIRQIKRQVVNLATLSNQGPLKIIPKLVAKGYSKNEVEEAISELCDSGEIDFLDIQKKLLESSGIEEKDSSDARKILYKHGFYIC